MLKTDEDELAKQVEETWSRASPDKRNERCLSYHQTQS